MNVKVLFVQSCLILCDPMDYCPPGSSVHGILQVRILERVAISFSRGSSPPRTQTQVSCTTGEFFTIWATREITREAIYMWVVLRSYFTLYGRNFLFSWETHILISNILWQYPGWSTKFWLLYEMRAVFTEVMGCSRTQRGISVSYQDPALQALSNSDRWAPGLEARACVVASPYHSRGSRSRGASFIVNELAFPCSGFLPSVDNSYFQLFSTCKGLCLGSVPSR